jgi:hypothetical protein
MSLKLKRGKKYRLKFYEPGVYLYIVGWDEQGQPIAVGFHGTLQRLDPTFNWTRYKEHKHGKA